MIPGLIFLAIFIGVLLALPLLALFGFIFEMMLAALLEALPDWSKMIVVIVILFSFAFVVTAKIMGVA